MARSPAACCTSIREESLDTARATELARMFKALGDPVRLREAGLIDGERRGTWVYYRPVPARIEQLATVLQP